MLGCEETSLTTAVDMVDAGHAWIVVEKDGNGRVVSHLDEVLNSDFVRHLLGEKERGNQAAVMGAQLGRLVAEIHGDVGRFCAGSGHDDLVG